MTRETRIGLLVGLMFIILFGLVLSELTGTSSARQAPLPAAGAPVPFAWMPVKEPAGADGDRDRARLLRLADDLASRPGGLVDGDVRPLGAQVSGVLQNEAHRGFVDSRIDNQGVLAATVPSMATGDIQGSAPSAASSALPEAATYTVQANDSLARIARKLYGAEHEREYRRIFAANRDKLPDESTLTPGQTLVIPPLPGADSPAPSAHTADQGYQEMDLQQLRQRFDTRSAPQTPRRRLYVVRRGDNLTSIARRMLNDDSRASVRKLFDANRDKLADPDSLTVGLELLIPS